MTDAPPMTPEEFAEAFEPVKARQDRLAMEVLQDLWHRMPWGETVVLSNGKEAVIKPLTKPKCEPRPPGYEDELHNTPCFGIDVWLKDGSGHWEYYIYQTGWGGAP